MVSVTRVTNLFHHMSKQVGTLQAREARVKHEKTGGRMEVSKHTKKGTVVLALQTAMIYDLSEKITYN